MANIPRTTGVDSPGFDDVLSLAERLNTASDDLNSALKQIEDRLNTLAIGIARFVAIPETRQVNREETDSAEWFEYQLGYDRLGDTWALVTRRAHFQSDSTNSGPHSEPVRFDEQKPLLRSSRQLRMKAVAAIPALLNELKAEAKSVLQVIEDAKRLAGDRILNVTNDVIARYSRHARISPLVGSASLFAEQETVIGTGEFMLPLEGAPILAFQGNQKLSNNFASDLRLSGLSDNGPFRLRAPFCYTRKPMASPNGDWSLVSPINDVVTIEYDPPRPIKRLRALLNNFDYDSGDPVVSETSFTRIGTPMVVQLPDRKAEFRRVQDYDEIYPLVRAGLLRAASLTEVSLDVLGETDNDLLVLANDVASFCTIAHGASIQMAQLTLLDVDNRPVRQLVTQPIRSRFQNDPIVADFHLPRLFTESFAAHVAMRRSTLPWHKLPSYCGSLEDMPYLEQKFASLMMAIEFFIRTSLLEHGLVEDDVANLDLNDLFGAAKKRLGWEIPKHYTTRDTTRLLRNAVMHGAEVPLRDNGEFRLVFSKWRLFLFRRILIRLAYRGEVLSPHKGWLSSSSVNDFSEAQNSFDTTDADDHPFAQMIKHFREHSKRGRGEEGSSTS